MGTTNLSVLSLNGAGLIFPFNSYIRRSSAISNFFFLTTLSASSLVYRPRIREIRVNTIKRHDMGTNRVLKIIFTLIAQKTVYTCFSNKYIERISKFHALLDFYT